MSGFTLKEQLIKPCADFSWREVKGELVVINMKSGEYHIFNSVGSTIWLAITDGKNMNEILKDIVNRYNVALEKASIETNNFINNLLQQGLLERLNPKKEEK